MNFEPNSELPSGCVVRTLFLSIRIITPSEKVAPVASNHNAFEIYFCLRLKWQCVARSGRSSKMDY